MKQDRSLNVPVKGMNKDAHPTLFDEKSYVQAINANYENKDGDAVKLQNEDSNILCSRFVSGFRVIGYTVDVRANRVYFFLVNTAEGQSEIGYIEYDGNEPSLPTDTTSECKCDIKTILANGLENVTQVATCEYETVIKDYNCPDGTTEGEGCLNFNINYPVSAVIKPEKCGSVLYFTDDLNPRRRLEVDKIAQYSKKTIFCEDNAILQVNFADTPTTVAPGTYASGPTETDGSGTGAEFNIVVSAGPLITNVIITNGGTGYEVGDRIKVFGTSLGGTPADNFYFTVRSVDEDCDCGQKEVDVCINCDKLYIVPRHEPLCIEVVDSVVGGELQQGQYTYYGGYCDEAGQMITPYTAISGATSVKNLNKNAYAPTELDEVTNTSLKLEIKNLDPSFEYYKIAVRQITDLTGGQRIFDLGVFSTSTTEIIHSSSANLTAIDDSSVIFSRIPDYTNAKIVAKSNNTLFFADLEARPIPNLQPVVNLMGEFATWRTAIADEDFYEEPRAIAEYRGYLRDEVYPLGIMFITKDGYETPVYPLVSRFSNDNDVLFPAQSDLTSQTTLIDNFLANDNPAANWETDVYSVLRFGSENCGDGLRRQKWQFYNTAATFDSRLYSQQACQNLFQIELEPKLIERRCVSTGSVEIFVPPGGIVLTDFDPEEEFVSLIDYINENNVTSLPAELQTAISDLENEFLDADGNFCDDCDPAELFPEGCVTESNPATVVSSEFTITNTSVACDRPSESSSLEGTCDTGSAEVTYTNEGLPCELNVEETYIGCEGSYYQRLPDTQECESLYVYAVEVDGKGRKTEVLTVGKNINEGQLNYWIQRAKGCADACPDSSGDFKGNDPNIFERFPNYLNNTNANQAYSITALPYDPSNENDINAIRFLFPNPNNPDGSGGGTPLTWLETKQQLLSTVPTNAFLFAPGQSGAVGDSIIRRYEREYCKCCIEEQEGSTPESPEYNGLDAGYQDFSVALRFEDHVHKNALWYEVTDIDTPFIIIDLSKVKNPERHHRDCAIYSRFFRVSAFDASLNLLQTTEDHDACKLVRVSGEEMNDGVVNLDSEGMGALSGWEVFYAPSSQNAGESPSTNNGVAYGVGGNGPLIVERDGVLCIKTEDADGNQIENLYITVESAIVSTNIENLDVPANWDISTEGEDNTSQAYATASENCFRLGVFTPALESVTLTLNDATADTLNLNGSSICTYAALCCIPEDKPIQCDPIPNQHGRFAYWESTTNYPNNEFLYNSQNMLPDVSTLDLGFLTGTELESVRTAFETYYLTAGQLNSNADFTCKPIRHFKFPDNHKAPILYDEAYNSPGQNSKISVIGMHIDNRIINEFLDLAVANSLVKQDFRDSITSYKIVRGDARLNQSIVGKGYLYDMIEYKQDGPGINTRAFFSNFPYNDYSDNELIYEDENFDKLVKHQGTNGENKRFSFLSPDTSFNKPDLPFEMYYEGYFSGTSRGVFSEVDNHPKMIVLSPKAYSLAKVLATTEIVLDLTLNISSFIAELQIGTSTNIGGAIAAGVYALAHSASAFSKGRIKVEEWLTIFRNLGHRTNFAYYYTSVGLYNNEEKYNFDALQGNVLRGLSEKLYLGPGRFRINEVGETQQTSINNNLRESSVYLYTPTEVTPPTGFTALEQSRFTGSELGCDDSTTTKENLGSIASAYVSLKDFLPNQYGAINSVIWLPTSYCADLEASNTCDIVFGGDIFLSRFWTKRKFPLFNKFMIQGPNRLADLTPFKYSLERNVGYPRYFIDYLTGEDDPGRFLGVNMRAPFISSAYEFDCLDITTLKKGRRGRRGKQKTSLYVQQGSKFYLAYYGIPGFITESRINLNLRYGRDDEAQSFYPARADYENWTQENRVSIIEDNFYYYNNLYSLSPGLFPFTRIRDAYDPAEDNCRFSHPDRVIYSLPDDNENDLFDNFRIFQALNFYDFGSKYGDLIDIRNIESSDILVRFSDGAVIYRVYNIVEGSQQNLVELGTGSMFAPEKAKEFFRTELGYGGTQHRAMVSCQYGHFWADAKRGKVFQLASGGTKMDEISMKGMKNWFRESLPFRIQKQFPDIPKDMLDNNFDSLGLAMTWDDRFTRLFVTKLDCKVKSTILVYTGPETGTIPNNSIRIKDLDFVYRNAVGVDSIVNPKNATYFEQASWTIAYSPITQSWVSFYSFLPNYYVSYQNYFSSGLNYGESSEIGIWNHLLGKNQSFQVYYGKLYPWVLEVPAPTNYQTKMYEDFSYRLDVRRYRNEFDYGYYQDNFDTMVLYNDRESTGLLNLITQVPNSQLQLVQYPNFNASSIDILATNQDYTWSVNYFFDNVRENYTQPLWINNLDNVNKTLNNTAFNYVPSFKNHIRGQYLIVQLSQNDESRLKFIFENYITDSYMYDAY